MSCRKVADGCRSNWTSLPHEKALTDFPRCCCLTGVSNLVLRMQAYAGETNYCQRILSGEAKVDVLNYMNSSRRSSRLLVESCPFMWKSAAATMLFNCRGKPLWLKSVPMPMFVLSSSQRKDSTKWLHTAMPACQPFRLISALHLWYHSLRLKVLLFAGAKSGAGGLDFQS